MGEFRDWGTQVIQTFKIKNRPSYHEIVLNSGQLHTYRGVTLREQLSQLMPSGSYLFITLRTKIQT